MPAVLADAALRGQLPRLYEHGLRLAHGAAEHAAVNLAVGKVTPHGKNHVVVIDTPRARRVGSEPGALHAPPVAAGAVVVGDEVFRPGVRRALARAHAAHVARRYPRLARKRHEQVRVILAHALLETERLRRRRLHGGFSARVANPPVHGAAEEVGKGVDFRLGEFPLRDRTLKIRSAHRPAQKRAHSVGAGGESRGVAVERRARLAASVRAVDEHGRPHVERELRVRRVILPAVDGVPERVARGGERHVGRERERAARHRLASARDRDAAQDKEMVAHRAGEGEVHLVVNGKRLHGCKRALSLPKCPKEEQVVSTGSTTAGHAPSRA